MQTLAAAQHPDGGYGGGDGQMPHLATSYAAILSSAMVGGADALESIDRRGMWKFLGKVKQANGGFAVNPGGETDVRYAGSDGPAVDVFC